MSPDQDLSDEKISTQIILHGAVCYTEVNQMSQYIYIYIYIYVTGKACNQAFHEILENFSHFLK